MTAASDEALDGNAAAGVLAEVFAMDVTAAIGQCAGCGQQSPLGATVAYLQAPGWCCAAAGATWCWCAS